MLPICLRNAEGETSSSGLLMTFAPGKLAE